MTEAAAMAKDLFAAGVHGVVIAWADNNGIPRARIVPVAALPETADRGVGITTLFAVFDTHDAITFAHPGLGTPSGDVRLVPQLDRLTPLAGPPVLAWVPGWQVAADGAPWPYDQRSVLEAQVERAAAAGLEVRAGYEMELVVSRAETGDDLAPAHPGPAYSPHALLAVDEFVGAAARPRGQRRPGGAAARRVRRGVGRDQPRGLRPRHRGRPSAAGPADRARRGTGARPAGRLCAAGDRGGCRERLAPAHVGLARGAEPADG